MALLTVDYSEVGPTEGTLLNSENMCKRVHVGGVYIDIRKII
jgi:hypothetical protein